MTRAGSYDPERRRSGGFALCPKYELAADDDAGGGRANYFRRFAFDIAIS